MTNFDDLNTLKLYFKEVKAFPLLNEEEEKILIRQAQSGSIEARNKLVNSNLRLVISIAKSYKTANNSLDLLDIISDGNIGLIASINKYDFSRNVKFSTCASWYIKQSITRAIENKGRVIRIPSYMQELISKVNKVESTMANQLKRIPTDEELAKELELTPQKIRKIKEYDTPIASLDFTIDDENETPLKDIIEDCGLSSPEASLELNASKEMLSLILQTLSEKEKEVICHRFGFATGKALTLEKTGEIMKISRERVRQIEEKALRKLRNPIRAIAIKEALT